MHLSELVVLGVLGAAVGVFGTLVGAGGGFILTPVLLVVYPAEQASTITAISLVVVLFNALSGSAAYARQRRIDYRSGIVFALATLPGAVAGSLLVGVASRRVFDALMTALLAGLAVWLFAGSRRAGGVVVPSRGVERVLIDRSGEEYRYSVPVARGAVISVGVGFVSSFLGIGGGVLHVPLLIGVLGFPVHIATATSHFVLANMAAVGTVTHVVSGHLSAADAVARAIALSVGVVGGAQLGAHLSQRIHGVVIQRLLAGALALLAVRLLFNVL